MPASFPTCRAIAAGALVLALGCQGRIAGDQDPGGDPGAAGGASDGRAGTGTGTVARPGSGGSAGTGTVTAPPPAPSRAVSLPRIDPMHGALGVRRLTRFELGNTVADLLGVKGAEVGIEEDDEISFLRNNQHAGKVGLADLEAYERAANRISTQAIATLGLPGGCTTASLPGDCVTRFLQDFLPRAFRRPAKDAEVQRYAALYGRLAPEGPQEALRGVLQAVLLSPSFLYRTEVGTDGKTLTSWEIASRLSYLVWGTMPDADLFARARENGLRDRAQVEAQLRRMLADGRARTGLLNVLGEWHGLHQAQIARKAKEVLSGLSSTSLQAALEEETRRFLGEALLGPGGGYEAVYGARFSYVNDVVAPIYGLKGITGKEFRRVDLDPKQRRGLFTQPLLLAAHTKEAGYSVVQMGRFVRERLLCQVVPPPPPDANTQLEESPATASLTFRQKFEQHATNPVCRACHQFLDPPGFAYLSYDPVGRYKVNDPSNMPFDPSGTLVGLEGADVPFTGAVTMLDGIAGGRDGKACFARKLAEYAFGRTLAKEDFPLYERLVWRLEDKGDLFAFLADLVGSKEFGLRGPDEAR